MGGDLHCSYLLSEPECKGLSLLGSQSTISLARQDEGNLKIIPNVYIHICWTVYLFTQGIRWTILWNTP